MTANATANLSVGINTKPAEDALIALRQKMEAMPQKLLINVDPTSIDADIQRYLRQRTFKVKVNTRDLSSEVADALAVAIDKAVLYGKTDRKIGWNRAALRGEVGQALDDGFNDTARHLRFDRERFVLEVKESLAAGLTGGVVKVAGVAGVAGAGGAATGLGADLTTVIQRTLGPAVDKLAAAAEMVAGVARKAGLSTSTGRVSAKESVSAIDPDTGFSKSFSRSLENPDKELADIQLIKSSRELLKAQQEQEKAAYALTQALDAQKIKEIQLAEAQTASAAAQKAKAAYALSQALDAQKLKEIGAVEALRGTQASRIDPATLLGLPSRESTKAMGAQIAAQMRGGVEEELLRTKSAPRIDPNTLLGLPSRDEMKRFGASLAAQMAEGYKSEQAKLASLYEKSKFRATDYNATGRKVVGASALVGAVGDQGAREFLGKSSYLVDEIKNLEDYRIKVAAAGDEHAKVVPKIKANTDAHKVLSGAMNEAHSAARGLAGSMGAMWATYGSVVPLVAAAAIGTAFRKVVEVGKEVEYQLAFVSALSDNAFVSLTKFGDALKGSLVGPVEAAQAMRGLAQNGLSVAESLNALPSILSLAAAGEMSLGEAALGATGVMAAFGLSVNDLGHVGDVFAKAAAISNTSVQGMVESMKQASQVGDEFHITIEQTAAALATLAQRNIIGTAAGTAFRNMMTELSAPGKKARDAMAQLGLSMYDSNKQLLPFEESIGRLRDTVVTLDEKSRIAFLGDMFGERGAKAVNALLNDFDMFKEKLKEITDESKNFTKAVTDALGDTTEGKLKKLSSEIQISFVQAFDDASSAAGAFVNQLRLLVASDEFKSGLKAIVDGVVTLTRALVDNWDIIKVLIASYASVKAIEIGAAVFSSLSVAVRGATIALVGLEAATAGAVAIMTGGLAVLGAAAAYLLLKDNTTEATRAQEAYSDKLRLANTETESAITRMREQNDVLERQIALQWSGVDAVHARAQAEGEFKKRAVGNLADELEANKKALAANKQQQYALSHDNGEERFFPRPGYKATVDEGAAIQKTIDEGEKALKLAKDLESLSAARDKNTKTEAVSRAVNEFNADLAAKKKKKPDITIEPIDLNQARGQSEDAVLADIKARKEELNANQLNKYTQKQPKDGAAHSLALAQEAEEVAAIQRKLDITKEEIKFARELDDAKYSTSRYGPYMAAVAAELRAKRELLDLDEERARSKAAFDAVDTSKFSDADKVRFGTKRQNVDAQFDDQQRKLEQNVKLASVKSSNAANTESAGDTNDLRKFADESQKQLADIYKKYNVKVLSTTEAAAMEARLKSEDIYRGEISKKAQDVAIADQAVLDIALKVQNTKGAEQADAQVLLLKAQERAVAERSVLEAVKGTAKAAADVAAEVAKSQQALSETAGYGWDKFWEDFNKKADSSAKNVEDVMKVATDGIAKSFENMASKGKLNFDDLGRSVLAMLTKIATDQALAKLASIFTPSKGSGSFVSSGSSSGGGDDWFGALIGIAGAAFDKGGIMTPQGPMSLRRYRDGGVATGPQVSVHGEGSLPEANVPLQDGRSIPVTLQGDGASSKPAISLNYAPVVHIDARADQGQIAQLVHSSVSEGNKQMLQYLRDTGAIA